MIWAEVRFSVGVSIMLAFTIGPLIHMRLLPIFRPLLGGLSL